MSKQGNRLNVRPRWRNLLLARALLFAISLVLSSSGEDVEPYDTTDRNLAAPRRLGQDAGSGAGAGGAAIEPLVEQAERELQSKSAKAKSSNIGSKSKSAKSFGSKSAKSFGSKSAKSFGSKSAKSSGSKSAKASGSKSAKASGSKSAKSFGSKSWTKSEKGKSAKSQISEDSEESLPANFPSSIEPMLIDSKTETEKSGQEDKNSVAEQLMSTETKSVYFDSVDVEGKPNASSVSISMSSNDNASAEETMEDSETAGAGGVPTSLDGIDYEEGVVVSAETEDAGEKPNLEAGDFAVERMEEDSLDEDNMERDTDGQNVDSNMMPNNSIEEEMEDTVNASTELETSSSETVDHDEGVSIAEVSNLGEAEIIEESMEESEALEKSDRQSAVLDLSRESVE